MKTLPFFIEGSARPFAIETENASIARPTPKSIELITNCNPMTSFASAFKNSYLGSSQKCIKNFTTNKQDETARKNDQKFTNYDK